MDQLLTVRADLDLESLRARLHVGLVRDQLALLRERFDLPDRALARGFRQRGFHGWRYGVQGDFIFGLEKVALLVDSKDACVAVDGERGLVDLLPLLDFGRKTPDRRALLSVTTVFST